MPGAIGSQLIDNLNAGKNQVLVVYGTSETQYGAWSNTTPGAGGLLDWLAGMYGSQITMINSGMAGKASNTGVANLSSLVLASQPNTVIIEFATNDANTTYISTDLDYGISPALCKQNLNQMINSILIANSDAEIILQTMNPVIDVGVNKHGTERPALLNYYQTYRDVAAQRGLRLIDTYVPWNQLLATNSSQYVIDVPDGLHPTAPASLAIALPTIENALTTGSGTPSANPTWTGGTDSNWATASNWNSASPGSGCEAIFNNSTAGAFQTVTTGSASINFIQFHTSSAAAYTLGGAFAGTGTIALDAAGAISVSSLVTASETINANVILGSGSGSQPFTFANNSTASGQFLTIAGNVSPATTGTKTLTLTGRGNSFVPGAIADGGGGTIALVKTGSGKATLAGANSYGGPTAINDGTLRMGAANAIATGTLNISATVSGDTAVLDLNGFNQTVGTLNLSGTVNTSAQITGSGTMTSAGTITFLNTNGPLGAVISTAVLDLNGSAGRLFSVAHSANATSDLTVSSVIQNGNINKNGAGTLLLTGSNTYAGGTTDQGTGVLALGNNFALGSGTLVMNTATVQSDSTMARAFSNPVTQNNGSVASYGGIGNMTFGGLLMSGGPSTSAVNNGTTMFSGITSNVGSIVLTKQGTGALVINGNITSSFANPTVDIKGGVFAMLGTYSGILIKLDGGVLGLSGSYTKSLGGSTAGTVQWTGTGSGGFAAYGANPTWGNPANNLVVNIGNAAATLTFGTTNFLVSGSTLILGNTVSNGTVNFKNGIDLAGATQMVRVNQGAANTFGGVDAILSGVIADGGLTKTGAGTLALTAINTYSGATAINNGELRVNGSTASGSTVNVGSAATLSGTGTIGGAVAVASGGILAPGNGAGGTLNISGTLSLTVGSALNLSLGTVSGGVAAGGGYVAPGSGTVTVNVTGLAGFGPGTYNLITGATGISADSFTLGSTPAGYTYTLNAGGDTLSLSVGNPVTPTGLSAVSGNFQVILTWGASSGATGYNVKRSMTSGSNYVTVASGVTETTFTNNTGLINGTTYYYVVSAAGGTESANSSQVGATPSLPIGGSEALVPAIVMSGTGAGTHVGLTVKSSVPGHSYQLQFNDDLVGGIWTNIGSPQAGTGGDLQINAMVDSLTVLRRFYRLLINRS